MKLSPIFYYCHAEHRIDVFFFERKKKLLIPETLMIVMDGIWDMWMNILSLTYVTGIEKYNEKTSGFFEHQLRFSTTVISIV